MDLDTDAARAVIESSESSFKIFSSARLRKYLNEPSSSSSRAEKPQLKLVSLDNTRAQAQAREFLSSIKRLWRVELELDKKAFWALNGSAMLI